MTEKQNTEALKRARTFSDNKDKIDGFYNGYVQATIELQKQIQIDAEQIRALQKQNGELTDKVKELEQNLEQTEKDLADYQFNYPTIKELQKENEELKSLKDVATLIRANNDTVITLMQLNNMLVSKSQQLTKAKELLKDITSSYGSTEVSEAQLYLKIKKAELFLKDSEGK